MGNQETGQPDRLTLLAFSGAVVIGGINFVAVRFSNRELEPLFGAGIRFAFAAVILLVVMRIRRVPFPRGSALFGALVYGLLGFTATYALAYWALLELPAGIASVVFAATPLLTLLLAPLHGIERFHLRGLVGSLMAIAGIGILANAPADARLPLLPLLAILGAAAAAAESGVIIKRFPPNHPVATNATAMAVGSGVLLIISALAGESWQLPGRAATVVALSYLVILGSVGLFGLFLFTLKRWTASAVAYITALFPVVTMIVGSLLADEAITANGVLGGAVVLGGVYVGALRRKRVVPGPAVAPAATGAD